MAFVFYLLTKLGDGGEHCLVRMEWCPSGWSVWLPLLIFPCTIKSRSSLLAPAHTGGPGKRAVKQLCCGGGELLTKLEFKTGSGYPGNSNCIPGSEKKCCTSLISARCYIIFVSQWHACVFCRQWILIFYKWAEVIYWFTAKWPSFS